MTHSIAKDATMLTLSKVLSILINFFHVMILSQQRNLKDFGTYSQIIIVVNLSLSIVLLGLPNSINYFIPRAESSNERNQFLNTYLSLGSLLTIIAGLLLLLLLPLITRFFTNKELANYSYVLVIFPLARFFTISQGNLLVASRQTKRLVIYTIAISLTQLFHVLLVQWADLTFSTYIALLVAIEVVFAFFSFYEFCRLNNRLRFYLKWSVLKPVLAFTVPIGVAYAVGTLNAEIDRAMIGYFLGTETLAIYSNASRELPISIVGASITAVLMPVLVKLVKHKDIGKLLKLWNNAVELSYISAICFSVPLMVFAPQFISLAYGAKYLPGSEVFRIYILVMLWRFTYFGIILNVSGNSKMILYSSVASLLLNVVLNYLCFLLFGMVGPAIATFISLGVMQLFQLWYSSKILNASFFKVFPWKSLLNLTLIGAIFTVFGLYVVSSLQLTHGMDDYLIMALSSIIWLIVYYLAFRHRINRLRGGMSI